MVLQRLFLLFHFAMFKYTSLGGKAIIPCPEPQHSCLCKVTFKVGLTKFLLPSVCFRPSTLMPGV